MSFYHLLKLKIALSENILMMKIDYTLKKYIVEIDFLAIRITLKEECIISF